MIRLPQPPLTNPQSSLPPSAAVSFGAKSLLPTTSTIGTRKVLIMLNPKAGGGHSPAQLQNRIHQALTELKTIEPSLDLSRIELTTQDSHEVVRHLQAHSLEYGRIIAAGGDGTVNHAIQLAQRFDLEVGILPLGTGNRLAQAMNLPTGLTQALHIALMGQPRAIDLMDANGKPSVLVAHVGVGQEIIERTNQHPLLKKLLGLMAYPFLSTDLALIPPLKRYRVIADGKTYTFRASGVAVVNAFSMAGLRITPTAQNNDGWLDVAIINANGRIYKTLWQLLRRTPGSPEQGSGLINFKARDIQIECLDHAVPVDIDGDNAGHTPLRVRLTKPAQIIGG